MVVVYGVPGSGKTEIARLLKKKGYKHFNVDDFYLKTERCNLKVEWYDDIKYIRKTYSLMEKEILKAHKNNKKTVLDFTGVSDTSKRLVSKLRRKAKKDLVAILLKVPIKVARQRINRRNKLRTQVHCDLNLVNKCSKWWNEKPSKHDVEINGSRTKAQVFKEVLRANQ